jgi:hypothetical protein
MCMFTATLLYFMLFDCGNLIEYASIHLKLLAIHSFIKKSDIVRMIACTKLVHGTK